MDTGCINNNNFYFGDQNKLDIIKYQTTRLCKFGLSDPNFKSYCIVQEEVETQITLDFSRMHVKFLDVATKIIKGLSFYWQKEKKMTTTTTTLDQFGRRYNSGGKNIENDKYKHSLKWQK